MAHLHLVDDLFLPFFFIIISWNMIFVMGAKRVASVALTALRGRLGQAFRNHQMRCYYTTIYLLFFFAFGKIGIALEA